MLNSPQLKNDFPSRLRFPQLILLIALLAGCSDPEYTRGASPVDSIARQFLHSVIQRDTGMIGQALSEGAKPSASPDSLNVIFAYFNGGQPASVELTSNEVAADESQAGVEHHRLQYRITFPDSRQLSYLCQLTISRGDSRNDTVISGFRFRPR